MSSNPGNHNDNNSNGKTIAITALVTVVVLLLTYIIWSGQKEKQENLALNSTTSNTTTQVSESSTTETTKNSSYTVSRIDGIIVGETQKREYAPVNFVPSSGKLSIEASSSFDEWVLLLPLIEDGLSEKYATLSSLSPYVDDYEELFCESDLIKNGTIKEVEISSWDNGYNTVKTVRFEVNNGLLLKAHIDWEDNSDSLNDEGATIEYKYRSDGLLSSMDYFSELEPDIFFEGHKDYRYESEGLLTETSEQWSGPDGVYSCTNVLQYENDRLLSVSSTYFSENGDVPTEEKARLLFSYDDYGRLKSFKNETEDLTGPFTEITYNSSNQIESIYNADSRMGDGNTFIYKR